MKKPTLLSMKKADFKAPFDIGPKTSWWDNVDPFVLGDVLLIPPRVPFAPVPASNVTISTFGVVGEALVPARAESRRLFSQRKRHGTAKEETPFLQAWFL